jgi:hypothetical protein
MIGPERLDRVTKWVDSPGCCADEEQFQVVRGHHRELDNR